MGIKPVCEGRMEEDMIEIICNKEDSDKSAKNPKDNSTCIRRPKNIKQIGDVSSDKKMFGTFRFEKKEYAELAYQIWKNMNHNEHPMYTIRGVFRLLNIDSEWAK